MKKKFFQIQEGVLTFVFEGTEDELKANFEQEKQTAVAFYEQAMTQCDERIAKHVRPAHFDTMSEAEQAAVDAELASFIAAENLKKSKLAEKIKTAQSLKVQDAEYFVFEPVKIQ